MSGRSARRQPVLSISIVGQKHRRNKIIKSSMQTTTDLVLEDLVQNSAFFGEVAQRRIIPVFEPNEVLSGAELGIGEFGIVSEVSTLCLDESSCDCQSPLKRGSVPLDSLLPRLEEKEEECVDDEVKLDEPPTSIVVQNVTFAGDNNTLATKTETTISAYDGRSCCEGGGGGCQSEDVYGEDEKEEEILAKNNTRMSMAANTHRNGTARYAVKRLIANSVDQKVRLDAAIDLACEAMFLQSITHTNIIHLRGTVGIPGTPGFALLLDRLVMTLEDKILEWRNERKRYQGQFFGLIGRRSEFLDNLLTERLLVCFDIARAMRHLHSRKILYRDSKPANIGFNVRGDVQIFDFGLAKELKPVDLVEPPDSYEATGLTGSRRFMAPEIVRCMNYGFKADVYSYSILLWQICALKDPFPRMDANKHFEHVVVKKKRPAKLRRIPPQVHVMMEDGWSNDPSKRPRFKQICQILRVVIADRRTGKSAANRSTHLMNRSLHSVGLDDSPSKHVDNSY